MNKISPRKLHKERDWEALSAYLDGQLSLKERARLEDRLRVDKELRKDLESLRQVKQLIQSQPKLRSPRNFTLTPEMAGIHIEQRQYPTGYPALRLASILATIFFIVEFAGGLITRSAKPLVFREAYSLEQEQATLPPMPITGVGGEGGGGEGQVESVPPPPAPLVGAEQKALALPTPTPEGARLIVTPLSTAAPTETPLALADQSVAPPMERAPQKETPGVGVATSEHGIVITSQMVFTVLQVLLALLAIGTGLGAVFLRRRRRQ